MRLTPTGAIVRKATPGSRSLFVACFLLAFAAFFAALTAAKAQTQPIQAAQAPASQTALQSPSPARGGQAGSETGPWRALGIAAVQEIPKLGTTLIGLGLAWWVGLRITAAWDMRKKRGEFDILLSKEFYAVVASFKAVAREWDALLDKKPGQPAVGADQTLQAAWEKKLEAWETPREALARRALDAETTIESILLKLVTEGLDFDSADATEKEKRARSLSLFRLAFRNLRETIETGVDKPPGWRHPEFWLFNRLSGEISRIIYLRSVNAPTQAKSPTLPVNGQGYLDLLALRTADLRLAAGRLKPSVEGFLQQRERDRLVARQENVKRLFKPESVAFVGVLRAGGVPPAALRQPPRLLQTQTLAVEVSEGSVDRRLVQNASQALFNANPQLVHYLVVFANDIEVFSCDARGLGQSFGVTDKLPTTLPWSSRPAIGADLLGWELQPETRDSLAKIASESLT